ncbi:MAG: DUF882 domain-containing protein [Deltaproteobacteria bacterium]|nr:DUF882 domain-containing protein [Deltaproteobacteria bacterium]MBW2537056.1 DUF882 domain-containing protein [Deltaproteobacteria bacterium]
MERRQSAWATDIPPAWLLFGLLTLLNGCGDGDEGTLGVPAPDGAGGSAWAPEGEGAGGGFDGFGSGGGDEGGGSGGASGPSARAACYPGPGGDYSICAPVVRWDSGWGSDYAYPSHASPQYAPPRFFIDLATADSGLEIADDFALDEVMQEHKGRYGVFQPHVVARLQEIRDQIGAPLHINSAFRNPAYNASVGGVTYSRHMFGDAADMWSTGASVQQIGAICDSLGAGYVGLYETFTHCDWRADPLEPAFFDEEAFDDESTSSALPEHDGWLERTSGSTHWLAPASGFDEGEPLREWTAYDELGDVIDEAVGASYEPPPQTMRVRVRVGGQIEIETFVGRTGASKE